MKLLKYLLFLGLGLVAIEIYLKISQAKLQHQRQDTLFVGTSADYPPYEFIDPATGMILGFDIDVIEQIAQRLGKKLVIKDMPFTSLIFELLTGDIDLLAAGLTATEQRKRLVSFTDDYLFCKPLVILTKKAKFQPQSMQDLDGRVVAVNTGHVAENYAATHCKAELIRLETAADAFMALQSDAVDAFVCAQAIVESFLSKHLAPEQFAQFVLQGTQESCAFAVDKQNVTLVERINTVLQQMRHDGSLAELEKKWKMS